jgi:type VI secretion system secreted protein VgrG
MIREVSHEGSHSALQSGDAVYSYSNTFTALPGEQVDLYHPPRRAIVPRIPGVITARIEANGGEYAALDNMGRYKIRLPFDLSDAKNYDGSKYVRLAQPYSGNKYGMHFPSHEGAEMILGCIDGDPDKPLGLGTIPNANTVSPVASANKEQNVIRTAGNNEMVMDDTKGKQKIRMTSAAKNAAEFDDENKRIVIQTTDGNKLLLDDKNEACSWNAKDHNVTMTYKGGKEGVVITTGGGHVVTIDDAGKKIVIESNAGNIIEMDDNAGKITMADSKKKNTVTLDGSQGLILDSKGKISIKAMQDVVIEGMNISMKANQAIQGKANTDVKLDGLNVTAKANANFKASGMAGATMESTGNTTVKGMMTKVEGTGQLQASSTGMAKFAGSMTQLEATGPMMVKGAVVMIN